MQQAAHLHLRVVVVEGNRSVLVFVGGAVRRFCAPFCKRFYSDNLTLDRFSYICMTHSKLVTNSPYGQVL